MRVATLARGGRDGTLVVVSESHTRCATVPGVATLQAALDDWDEHEGALREAARRLGDGPAAGMPFDLGETLAILPRAYGWLDGSTYLAHMERLRLARGAKLPPDHSGEPIVHQSGSDRFLAAHEDVALVDPDGGLDLEATVAVITGDIPVGANPDEAASLIRFVTLANDLTYRNILPREFAKGVGFVHTKPARPLAAVAVTPDALGDAWTDGMLSATVSCTVNGERLGDLDPARDCSFPMHELIAYIARVRSLAAGTIVGSGTISNRDERLGFGCLAEKRATEITAYGASPTRMLCAGDHVRIEAFDRTGVSLFGAISSRVSDHERGTTPKPRGPQ